MKLLITSFLTSHMVMHDIGQHFPNAADNLDGIGCYDMIRFALQNYFALLKLFLS